MPSRYSPRHPPQPGRRGQFTIIDLGVHDPETGVADPRVVTRLRQLSADVVVCRRAPGVPGDPCLHTFHDAVKQGALPFCCQGSENGLCIEGGMTLAWEMIESLERSLEATFPQVAPGANHVGPDVDSHPTNYQLPTTNYSVDTSAEMIPWHEVQTMARPPRGSGDVKLTCVRFSLSTRRLRTSSWQCGHRAGSSS